MDPLPQYASHEFISCASTSSSSNKSLSEKSPIFLLNTSTWTYSGPLLLPAPSKLPPSFHSWLASTIQGPLLPRLLPVLAFLHTFLSTAGIQHYWLTIRATKPTRDYDTPRWHTDDNIFDFDEEKDRVGLNQRTPRAKPGSKKAKKGYWKLATTLLGPGTLFLSDGKRAREKLQRVKSKAREMRGEHACSEFRCLGCFDAVKTVRERLAVELAGREVESPEPGQVAFFRLGDEEGSVHSEPPCHTDRIFVNVVPGTEEELRALMSRWGMGFPRAWCFGVPVAFDDTQAFSSSSSSNQDVPDAKPTRVDSMLDQENGDTAEPGRNTAIPHKDPWSLSTMSTHLRDEYAAWLEARGFQFAQVFGQRVEGRNRTSDLNTSHSTVHVG